jgi:DNA-binding transcriptional regulator YiaG
MLFIFISGKILKKVRSELGMTQPQFAKWLSRQTGEHLDAKKISRVENHGKEKASNPMAPSLRVYAAISSLFPHLLPKKSKNAQSSPSDFNNSTGEVTTMTQDQKAMLRKFVKLYQDLGILEVQGETATEMIEAVKSNISQMENELVGGTSEIADIQKELQELEVEKVETIAELQEIDRELSETDPTLLKKYAPDVLDVINAA